MSKEKDEKKLFSDYEERIDMSGAKWKEGLVEFKWRETNYKGIEEAFERIRKESLEKG